MNEISGLTEERAHRLAYRDTELTAKLVSKLTGLDAEAAARMLQEAGFEDNEGCSGSELVKLCSARDIPLPLAFRSGLRDLEETNKVTEGWVHELMAVLRQQKLTDTVVDYAAFRRLTTFDANEEHPHTGDRGLYAYRSNAFGETVGIVSGPAMIELIEGEPGSISAEHQRDAHLDLPTTAYDLVIWIGQQGGDVQFIGSHPAREIAAINHLAQQVPTSQGIAAGGHTLGEIPNHWIPYSCRPRAKALQRLVVNAVNGLGRHPADGLASQEVVGWLASKRSTNEVRLSGGGYEYFNGAGWANLSTGAVAAQLRTLAKVAQQNGAGMKKTTS